MGPYVALRLLGEGGMGRVFLARRSGDSTAAPVALKVVHRRLARDAQFRARFRREIASARAVESRYVVPLVDADAEADVPWLATAYVPGPSLAEVVAADGPLAEEPLRTLSAALAGALGDIHGRGLVHRDLKPSNILIHPDAGPLVIDLGIAQAVDATRITSTGVAIGTPGYMAPEQFTGGSSHPAVDVFAFGAVLAFAATGRKPFGEGPVHRVGYRMLTEEPDLAGCPEFLLPLLTRCLAKDPEERPGTRELLDARPFGDAANPPPPGVANGSGPRGERLRARPFPAGIRPHTPRSKRGRLALATVLVGALVAGGIALHTGTDGAARPSARDLAPPAAQQPPSPSAANPTSGALPPPVSVLGTLPSAADWPVAWRDVKTYTDYSDAEWDEMPREYALEVWLTDKLFVRVTRSGVQGLAPATGQTLWTLSPPAPGMLPCRVSRTTENGIAAVVFGSLKGTRRPTDCDRVVAIDLDKGTSLWDRQFRAAPHTFDDLDDTEVVGVGSGRVVVKAGSVLTAWRSRDGEQLWQSDSAAENCALNAIAIGPSTIAEALTCPRPAQGLAKYPTSVRSVDAADGRVRWTSPVPDGNTLFNLETAEPLTISLPGPQSGARDTGPMLVFDGNGKPGPQLRTGQDFGDLGAWPRNRDQLSPRVFGWKDTVVTTTSRGESGADKSEVVAIGAGTGRIRWHVPVRRGYDPLIAGVGDRGVLVVEWGQDPALLWLDLTDGRISSAGALSGVDTSRIAFDAVRVRGPHVLVMSSQATLLRTGALAYTAAGAGAS
ncbi:protein kinase [Embleya sp. NPDC059259]|uniref:serine/threonine-protein kinase n=1 Tax=unclassified Embleya TaxID=2699296 RepID=UPI0036B67CAD